MRTPQENADFSVKIAYHWAFDLRFGHIEGDVASFHVMVNWHKLWKIPIPPRIRFFMWKACTDCLPVLENLRNRGLQILQIGDAVDARRAQRTLPIAL